jgi:8-oxo-dGTP diphosphatase
VHFSDYDTRLAAYAVIVDDEGRILLTWWNGEQHPERAGWSLPGGGVDYDETVLEAVVREVREETGYDVEVGAPIGVHSFTAGGLDRPGRPFKGVQVLFDARITGGELGTLEVAGTTDFARWLPLDEVAAQPSRAEIVDLAVALRGYS